jgi:hypothetical protein
MLSTDRVEGGLRHEVVDTLHATSTSRQFDGRCACFTRRVGGAAVSNRSAALSAQHLWLASASLSWPRGRRLARVQRNIGYGNADDRARYPVRAVDTIQFWLVVGRGTWRWLGVWDLDWLLRTDISHAQGHHHEGSRKRMLA